MMCIVQNERFIFEIDSENSVLDCGLEHWTPGVQRLTLVQLSVVEKDNFQKVWNRQF